MSKKNNIGIVATLCIVVVAFLFAGIVYVKAVGFISSGECSNQEYSSEADCTAGGGTWDPNVAVLEGGVVVTGAPGCSNSIFTSRAECENNGAQWGVGGIKFSDEPAHIYESYPTAGNVEIGNKTLYVKGLVAFCTEYGPEIDVNENTCPLLLGKLPDNKSVFDVDVFSAPIGNLYIDNNGPNGTIIVQAGTGNTINVSRDFLIQPNQEGIVLMASGINMDSFYANQGVFNYNIITDVLDTQVIDFRGLSGTDDAFLGRADDRVLIQSDLFILKGKSRLLLSEASIGF